MAPIERATRSNTAQGNVSDRGMANPRADLRNTITGEAQRIQVAQNENIRRDIGIEDDMPAGEYPMGGDAALLQMSNAQIDRLMEIHPYLKQRIEEQLAECKEQEGRRARAIGGLAYYLNYCCQRESTQWRRICDWYKTKLGFIQFVAVNLPGVTVRRAWNAASRRMGEPPIDSST